ncbi:MAG: peptide chain release factor N(5)-glutamine methyltransferase [Eubacteriales bacterium]|nr:peptide chain release factor N(5)-glutamine methyltransferase [Eubacteriales bacterium]
MDYKKIFIKEACPTSIGGQAIMEGVMMRGPDRTAIAMRLPSNEIYLRTKKLKPASALKKIPILRGVLAFVDSLVIGMGTLMESADILEANFPEEEGEEPSKFEQKITEKFGEKAIWNILMTLSVVFAIVLSVGIFIIFPTVAINWLGKWISSSVALNLIEGIFRIILFILYIFLISRMNDIKTLFQYHGSEHKTIHCYENNLELTPENAQQFYTLHPRCGTSFLIFVMIISLLLFSFLGWPNVWLRIGSRILLIPVIAGLSYEVLRVAGKSDNLLVRILSYPGLMMQKLTTKEPTNEQLEVAIVSLKAVLVDPDTPVIDGIVDKDAHLITEESTEEENSEGADAKETDVKESETEPAETPEASAEEENSFSSFGDHAPSEEPSHPKGIRYDSDDGTLGNLLRWGKNCLSMVENGAGEAVEIMQYVMGYSRTDIILREKEVLSEDNRREFEKRIENRLAGTPLQYITGVQEFMGLMFRVNPNVLIPRLDTEVLVDQAIGILKGRNWENPFILDMCTGSGAIGVTMAHEFPDAEVTLVDVSKEAISTAMGNAQINEVFRRCIFLEGDMFQALPENKRYDMILSNPPYIESDVIETLSTEVKDHEPRLALDGGQDGLKFYRILAEEAEKYLSDGGYLVMEIGYNQGDAVKALLENNGNYKTVAVLQDLNHLDRIVIGERKERE